MLCCQTGNPAKWLETQRRLQQNDRIQHLQN
jgi:hypothetical protein